MHLCFLPMRRWLLPAVISIVAFPAPAQDRGDVVKVNTALVQTDVTVLDSGGKFVEGLTREQFNLKVDGKPREILFFERVIAGSRNEEAQLAAARGDTASSATRRPVPLDRGRVILFFIDDIHLSPSSLNKTRKLLARFIEREMTQNDEIAITSTSGQIGFLQQLTNNQTVLRKAIERLSLRNVVGRDHDRPPMSEYQAQQIENNDLQIASYFVEALIKDGVPPDAAARIVQARATQILAQGAHFARASLTALQSLVDSSKELAGRKMVFFISDGFLLHERSSDNANRLRELTTQAARAGVVISTIDARGLIVSTIDASVTGHFDPTGRLEGAAVREVVASQDALHILAANTGGRASLNNNDLSRAVTTIMKETSTYYLLAWRPETDDQGNQKLRRLDVSIIGKPGLVVRFRRGVNEAPASASAVPEKSAKEPKTSFEALSEALRSTHPKSGLPVYVTLNFLNLPERGPTLATSMKVLTDSVKLEMTNGTASANLDVVGLLLDEQGKPVRSFNKRLTIRATSTDTGSTAPESIFYHDYNSIKPGLYNVRVAAFDEKQKRVGSASEWIEIPDLNSKKLSLSTLVVAEEIAELDPQRKAEKVSAAQKNDEPFARLGLNIDHRFARTSRLQFLLYIYNAATASPSGTAPNQPVSTAVTANVASPDLALQAQIFRDNEPVMTRPLMRVEAPAAGDMTRIPFAADLLLQELQPGRYVLQVTVIDRISKTTASQRFRFQVE